MCKIITEKKGSCPWAFGLCGLDSHISNKMLHMKTKTLQAVAFYLIFLTMFLLFSLETFKEYLANRTSFKVTREPLSVQDLPTIITCLEYPYGHFRLNYGQDLSIDVIVINQEVNKTITLQSKNSSLTMFGLQLNFFLFDTKKFLFYFLVHKNKKNLVYSR